MYLCGVALLPMLREKDLDFYVASDTVLLITTADVAKIAGTVQVYYVRDLLEKRTAENDSPGPCRRRLDRNDHQLRGSDHVGLNWRPGFD